MQRILILAAANIATCPRAMAMARMLKDDYDVSVMGIDNDDGSKMAPVMVKDSTQEHCLQSFSYPTYKRRTKWEEFKLYCNVAFQRWDKLSFIHNRLAIIEHLEHYQYDMVICHDLLLLPVLFAGLERSGRIHKDGVKHKTKVIFDAQEFYPLQNTSSLRWRVLFKRFNTYLCATYIPKADMVFTASPAFCEMYKKHFGINTHLLMPLPSFYNLTPRVVNAECIRILYHGALNQNRGIDKVIELCRWLDKRFYIDFIFVGGQRAFRTKIESRIHALQSQGKHIRILPPLALNQIVSFGNAYDIGLIYIPPHNHNLRSTLPNKFFEYIQSRLVLLMPPLEQMMVLSEKYHNAIITRDFTIRSLANALNVLSCEDIMRYKQNSHKAAQEYNLSHNISIVRHSVKKLLENKS